MTPAQTLKDPFNSRLFIAACLAYFLLFFQLFPPIYAFRDEGIYLSLAQVFKAGTVFIEKAGIPISIYVELNGHRLPFYPPGNPLTLIPFTLFGLKSVFAMGLCFHLLGAFLFRKLAKIFDCDHPVAFLLYLFFPSFVFYSRTIMSDIPSLALFLAAYYFYFKSSPSAKGLSGIFFGLSLFFRVSNVVILFPFFAGLFVKSWREKQWGQCVRFCAAAAPFAAAMGLYNHFIYGSPFLSGYSEVFSGVKNFSSAFLSKNTLHYFLTLNTAYPFMLLIFLFSRRIARLETYLLTLILFIFFGFYYFLDRYPHPVMAFVFGNRFFYPLIPFLIMAFARLLQTALEKCSLFYQKILVLLLALVLFSGSAAIHIQHENYLLHQAASRDTLYQNTREGDALIYDGTVAELIQAAWGKRFYIQYETYGKLQTSLNNLPVGTDTYVVIRKTSHGTTQISGALFTAFETIKKSYGLRLKTEANGISLYQLTQPEGGNALT